MFDLKGKTALVTGSSQGIGKEIAKALKEHGAIVYAHGSRPSEKLNKAAEYIGTDKTVTADLTDMNAANELFNATGGVDILILNASVQYKREWDKFTDEEVDSQIDCNLKSTYYFMQKFAPYMIQNKFGRIITIGSVNQYNNHPELLLYGVTKCAQMKLVEGVAKQLAPFGVTVNNIAPGAILTPRNADCFEDEEFKQKIKSAIPSGTIGDPKDMNGAVLLLCSKEGSYITGSEIIADGGMHL